MGLDVRRILPGVDEEHSELARLMSLVAHELRTPLSVACGYLKMLGSERGGPLTEAQRRAVAGADRACQQLTALAADMSWLGRLERGEVTPNRAPVPLAPLLRELAGGHTPHDEHPVTVEALVPDADAAGRGDLTVMADRTHLRRALHAMLAAVIRAAPDHAVVQVTGQHQRDGQPPLLRIAVAPAQQLTYLLTVDPAALDAMNESQGGLGVGLPLARRLMGLDRGAIYAHKDAAGALGLLLTLPA